MSLDLMTWASPEPPPLDWLADRPAPLLDILVLTIKSRQPLLAELMGQLLPQVKSLNAEAAEQGRRQPIRIVVLEDDGDRSIGAKRQQLLDVATADYVCSLDDDDLVDRQYARLLAIALAARPDLVGFRVARTVNGVRDGQAIHSCRLYDRYGEHPGDAKGVVYERTINHLNPVRRDWALQIGFVEGNHGEDSDYARRLSQLISGQTGWSEAFIDRELYLYRFRTEARRRGEVTNAKPVRSQTIMVNSESSGIKNDRYEGMRLNTALNETRRLLQQGVVWAVTVKDADITLHLGRIKK